MAHLSRAVKLLIGVILAVVVVRWVVTSDFVPGFSLSLGTVQLSNAQLGRPTVENAQEWASLPVQYQGSASCAQCHEKNYTAWSSSSHATVNCETCHGPARAHIKERAAMVVERSREFCGTCHAQLPSRPASFPQVELAEHNPGTPCIQCHNPHSPQIQRPPAIPHSLEGRSDCLMCHGKVAPLPQSHAGRASDTCLNCHSRGEGS